MDNSGRTSASYKKHERFYSATRLMAACPSVCPRLSHAGVDSKLVTAGSYDFQRRVAMQTWYYTGWDKTKYPNTQIAISQKCLNMFAPNFAHLFVTILCTNVLFCVVFTWHMSNWRKPKLQERISQLNKTLILLLK